MEFQYLVIARALHVVAVVLWIGGVAFVATVLIPAIRNAKTTDNKLHLFEMLESKFSLQAKLTTLITGLSGFYMLYAMNLWSTIHWWIYTMLLIWVIFTLVLFILEPWFLHKWFHQQALKNSNKAFYYLQLMHTILLTMSLLVIFAGVAGAHGLFY